MCSEDAADPMHIGGPDNRKMDLQLLYQLAFGCDLGRVIFMLSHSLHSTYVPPGNGQSVHFVPEWLSIGCGMGV